MHPLYIFQKSLKLVASSKTLIGWIDLDHISSSSLEPNQQNLSSRKKTTDPMDGQRYSKQNWIRHRKEIVKQHSIQRGEGQNKYIIQVRDTQQRPKSFFLQRNDTCPPPSTHTKYHDRMTIREEREAIIYKAIIQSYPQFPDFKTKYINVSPLKGLAQQKFGDYTCTNILTMWESLRRFEPSFFDKARSRDIAQTVLEAVEKNPKNKMITELKLHDAGFLTFRLSWKWMCERIQVMLDVGIDLWAPVIEKKLIVIDGPEPVSGADMYAEEIRSCYIREMLMCMLDYSGVAVSTGLLNKTSLDGVQEYFTKKQGVITSKSRGTPLFAGKSEILARKFHVDLQALWSAIYELKAQSIVYITSVRQLEYVDKCFDVATNEGWLSVEWNPLVIYQGYRTSSYERRKLAHVWTVFGYGTNHKVASLVELGRRAGYTPEASMECAIKYTYLKTHRLAECTFNINEMLDKEGNTFVYLLETRNLISILCENSGGGIEVEQTIATCREEHELVTGKSAMGHNENTQQLAVHLVQFTEVIEMACLSCLLHPVCDYLWDLCRKFLRYCNTRAMHSENRLQLVMGNATKEIMDKCFHLLRITPDSSTRSSRFPSKEKMTGVEVIPWPVSVARPKDINPRFEMFCMNVCVADNSFRMGSIHGIVSLVDADGLLSDGRLPLNKRENGHVAYFYREWYESIDICDGGYVYFETPSPSHLVPFSSDLEIFAKLYVTTEDKCFQMCFSQEPIDLSEMWADKPPSFIRRTLRYYNDNGCTSIDYIALRDAVDTTMKLSLKSPNGTYLKQHVFGYILASYGDMLDDHLRQGCYKATIFEACGDGRDLEVGPVSLQKSVMAVPVEGYLVLEARFSDKSTGTVVCNRKYTLYSLPEGKNSFYFDLKEDCFLKLEVEWSQGPKSSYC